MCRPPNHHNKTALGSEFGYSGAGWFTSPAPTKPLLSKTYRVKRAKRLGDPTRAFWPFLISKHLISKLMIFKTYTRSFEPITLEAKDAAHLLTLHCTEGNEFTANLIDNLEMERPESNSKMYHAVYEIAQAINGNDYEL